MEGATELTALHETSKPSFAVDPRAETVVNDFFNDLKERHKTEAVRLQQLKAHPNLSRSNQQKLYLDEKACAEAMEVSRRFLGSHTEWLTGRNRLSAEELRERVALHHLTSIDIDDLTLPKEERRSDDSFTDYGVSEQFILDAGRSDFLLGEEEVVFSKELEASGINQEDEPLEVEHRLRDFEERLVQALIRSLGGHPQRILLQAISRSMSQSGMANLERACTGPQFVVSGCDQTVRYKLVAAPPDSWDVHASICKKQFEEFVVLDEKGSDDSGKVSVVQCSADSCISQSCALRFKPGSTGLQVDVLDFARNIHIVDSHGARLMLPGQVPKHTWKETMLQCLLAMAKYRSLRILVATCCQCRQRARKVASVLPTGLFSAPELRRPRCDSGSKEDGDGSITAPLRELPPDSPV